MTKQHVLEPSTGDTFTVSSHRNDLKLIAAHFKLTQVTFLFMLLLFLFGLIFAFIFSSSLRRLCQLSVSKFDR